MRIPFRHKKSEKQRQKQVLERAKNAQANNGSVLALVPPEGVPLNFRLASVSARAGAQVTDFIVTLAAAIVFILLLLFGLNGFDFSGSVLTIVVALTFFFIRVPYYIVTELVWNGRTLAKRWMSLRVISRNGRSLSAHQVVMRNIMKEVEFFAPLTFLLMAGQNSIWITMIALVWLMVLIIVPWRSKTNQRVGDIIANTCVIEDPKPVLLHDLAGAANSAARERFVFATQHLDHYGRFELQMLEQVLRVSDSVSKSSLKQQRKNMTEIADRIVKKIGYNDTIASDETREFLAAFYRAQRAHLESRKLFGDAREDKFFNDPKLGEDELSS